jgi:hypothetical protein
MLPPPKRSRPGVFWLGLRNSRTISLRALFVLGFLRNLPTSVIARRRILSCVSSSFKSSGCVRLTKLKAGLVERSMAGDLKWAVVSIRPELVRLFILQSQQAPRQSYVAISLDQKPLELRLKGNNIGRAGSDTDGMDTQGLRSATSGVASSGTTQSRSSTTCGMWRSSRHRILCNMVVRLVTVTTLLGCRFLLFRGASLLVMSSFSQVGE